jgi:hypothetical protein
MSNAPTLVGLTSAPTTPFLTNPNIYLSHHNQDIGLLNCFRYHNKSRDNKMREYQEISARHCRAYRENGAQIWKATGPKKEISLCNLSHQGVLQQC